MSIRENVRLLPLAVALVLTLSGGGAVWADDAEVAEGAAETESFRGFDGIRSAFADVSGIELSGFFDVQAADASGLSVGSFELGLARDLGPYAQLAAAIVANEEGASAGVAFVDIHFFGGLVAPRGRLPVEKGFHLQFGRFDVPFGQDWQYYAAKDRVELSAPLTTESLLGGGLNDVGVRIFGGNGTVNASAFAIRSDASGNLYGGRIGVAPFDVPYRFEPRTRVFEAGVSLMQDLDGGGDARSRFMAVDAEAAAGRCRVRTEYVVASEAGEREAKSGWHITAAFDAGEHGAVAVMPYARYDTVEERSMARTSRVTAGLNGTLFRFLLLKLEWQHRLAAPAHVDGHDPLPRDSWAAQAVIVF